MSCTAPILAERLTDGTVKLWGPLENFFSLFKDSHKSFEHSWLVLPCGKCLSCRMRRARDWCIRCQDELLFYERSCFVTLTYNDVHLPSDSSLCRRDYQLFLKRLRRSLPSGCRISYFGCGEYGRENLRPHYHFIIFGWSPDDVVPWSFCRETVYTSSFLDSLWSDAKGSIGFATVGSVTPDSIAYVARYSLKKLDLDTSGKNVQPFLVSSSRPAIGLRFLEKFSSDVFKISSGGYIRDVFRLFNGRQVAPPRYYIKKFLEIHPEYVDSLQDYLLDCVSSQPITLEGLARDKSFSDYREKVHNTHYVRDLLALIPDAT